MTEPCGCESREGHVEPYVDPDLHIGHGERDALNGDPLPHEVPGSAFEHNGWRGFPDKFCLCGHPNYLTCTAWPDGGIVGLTLHNVGGYLVSTRTEDPS